MKCRSLAAALAASVALPVGAAQAVDLEVTHWWTSGGEAAAVAEFAKAFDATGNKWVDGAIAGSGSTARPIMISRITGGDPMGATQFNHGRQAEELVEAGLMRDLTDVAEEGNWTEVVNPPSLLESCTLDGKIYCVPVNIHSWQWLWLSNKAFEEAGVPVPTNWDEFVAAAPALEAAGKIPLAMGKQPWQAVGRLQRPDPRARRARALQQGLRRQGRRGGGRAGDGARSGRPPTTRARWRRSPTSRTGTRRPTWSSPTQAGGQIMGDWAQGEFQVAGEVAGTGLHLPARPRRRTRSLGTAGDAFYFPLIEDEEISAAQAELAKVMLAPETQVAFNLKKGSLPVRGDVDLAAANDCMKKGLEIISAGNVVTSTDQLISPDTNTQLEDLMSEFFSDMSLTPEDAQARWAEIIADAD